ncbi:CRAL-TRIO domain-containing protein [Scheffersomyces coipomensis]|uniref:CRAL-TRIO domain-containing protein n=1 Tax=Scheffersomyces coipomensis TaxID=1788519 RepID=UPI00315CAF9D
MTTDLEQLKKTITTTELTTEQLQKLNQLIESIPQIIKSLDNSDYDEIFGYRINSGDKEYIEIDKRNEILLKFLIANKYDVTVTKDKLKQTLNWRNQFKPLHAAFESTFDSELKKLGVITDFGTNDDSKKNLRVLTWNLYGNIKSPKELFEKFGAQPDTDEDDSNSQFLKWRIGLMEKSLALIDFSDPNNHKIGQIHDYKNVSMFRMDPGMKASTSKIIDIFGNNYPELLSIKFFINVPSIMTWVFLFFKKLKIISPETLNKFEVLNNGDLTSWINKSQLPKDYSGNSTKSIYDLEVENSNFKIPKYGEIILKRLGDKEIEDINNDVE